VLGELQKGKAALEEEGAAARERVTKEFSIGRMVESYRDLYEEVIARCAASAAR
jgi:glycosyltransferase involved in cell wall biosynthesis